MDEVNEKISLIQENCLAIYNGFHSVDQIAESILYCCESMNKRLSQLNSKHANTLAQLQKHQESQLEHLEARASVANTLSLLEKVQSEYNENVVLKLDSVKQIVGQIRPLNYRLEIVENIYSLIFLSSNDLKEQELDADASSSSELDEDYAENRIKTNDDDDDQEKGADRLSQSKANNNASDEFEILSQASSTTVNQSKQMTNKESEYFHSIYQTSHQMNGHSVKSQNGSYYSNGFYLFI